jgi:hypothetical protein
LIRRILMAYSIPPSEQLRLDEDWQVWKECWQNYELATGVAEKDDKIRVATLLAIIGKEANRVYNTFKWTEEGDKKKIDKVIKQFKDFCTPKRN